MVTTNAVTLICRLVAIMILSVGISQWKITMLVSSLGRGATETTTALLAVLFIVLLITSVGGIFWRKTWGFYYFYVLNFLATFFFSISLVPFIADFLPAGWHANGVIVINGMLLLFAMSLQREVGEQAAS